MNVFSTEMVSLYKPFLFQKVYCLSPTSWNPHVPQSKNATSKPVKTLLIGQNANTLDHVSFRVPRSIDRCIGRCIDGHATDMSIHCWPRVDRCFVRNSTDVGQRIDRDHIRRLSVSYRRNIGQLAADMSTDAIVSVDISIRPIFDADIWRPTLVGRVSVDISVDKSTYTLGRFMLSLLVQRSIDAHSSNERRTAQHLGRQEVSFRICDFPSGFLCI